MRQNGELRNLLHQRCCQVQLHAWDCCALQDCCQNGVDDRCSMLLPSSEGFKHAESGECPESCSHKCITAGKASQLARHQFLNVIRLRVSGWNNADHKPLCMFTAFPPLSAVIVRGNTCLVYICACRVGRPTTLLMNRWGGAQWMLAQPILLGHRVRNDLPFVQAVVRLPQADCRRLAAAAQEPSQDEIDLTAADEVHLYLTFLSFTPDAA